ncbi:YafY family transcriptional regulator [Paenibacillus sp. KQZ6P-2]|uniref:YafY family transcriptional regulator n=1 Tax=Paenibacillus mangrovi TaxID=2931978 RepID=A0A9X1WVW3_9BACL|nr:YafY family protein [Paenibacillus mangrovi]MCJ8012904.1 YafY family transcriptional regulator [Paenibacillus mangrovi]
MKIDRLLAMTVLLLNRGRISAKELAERFEVSTKTIYRDMDTLSRAGIPVMAHQGSSGGFEMMSHYTISRQFLTMDEITSIFTAVKGVRAALDDRTLDQLLDKVGALLQRSDNAMGMGMSQRLLFDLNPWGQGKGTRDKVSMLRRAVFESRKVNLQYINMNGSDSWRTLEPGRLILKGNVWYLQAFCTRRDEFRIFRVSRILEMKVLPDIFEPRELPLLDAYEWKPEWSTEAHHTVTMRFSPQVRHRVSDSFSPEQISVQEDGSLLVKGEYPLDEWFYGMVLSYGDQIVIEAPELAAMEVVRRVQNILQQYMKPDRQVST